MRDELIRFKMNSSIIILSKIKGENFILNFLHEDSEKGYDFLTNGIRYEDYSEALSIFMEAVGNIASGKTLIQKSN